jgi:hypothetical protein
MPTTKFRTDATAICNRGRGNRLASWFVLVALGLNVAACGGGGGRADGGGSPDPSQMGIVKVTVTDSFGSPVAGASVEGPTRTTQTDASGATLVVLDAPDTKSTLKVSRDGFVYGTVDSTAALGRVNEVVVVLDRVTSPAGASLGTRSGALPSTDGTGSRLSFEIELVLVDGNANPIDGLAPADFALRACTPDPNNRRVDCVRGAGADDDKAYTPVAATPVSLERVPGGAARPYAAALLLDQSSSIRTTDPTSARLYSAKAFLGSVGDDDRALLAAFASDPGALIPTSPLTAYGPFRDRSSASAYYPTLDSLAAMVGGNTPLYTALDALRLSVVGDTALPADLTRAVALFTDGSDTSCGDVSACRKRRAQSIQGAIDSQVRLFTIGLSRGVDVAALGELANQTGGAFLYADSAEQLLPLYGSLGKLMSLSLPTYRLRWTIQADSANTFKSGHTVLGRVQVRSGSSSFDVPFLVGVP